MSILGNLRNSDFSSEYDLFFFLNYTKKSVIGKVFRQG